MKNPAASHPHRPGRRELLLAVLAGAALLLAHSSWLLCEAARDELFRIEMDTVRLADSVAESQQALLARASKMLNIVGGITLSRKNLAACDDFLARQLDIFPTFENLAFADANGKVTCSARAKPIALPAAFPDTADKPVLHSLSPDQLAFVLPRKAVRGAEQGWVVAVLPAKTLFPAGSPGTMFGLAHEGKLIAVHPAANAQDNLNPLYSGLMRAIGLSAATPVTTRDGTEWLHAAPVKGSANELWLLARLTSDTAAAKVMRMAASMAIALVLAGFLLWALGRRVIPWLASINWRCPELAARIRHNAHSLYKKLRQIEWRKARHSASGMTGITELRIAYERLKQSFAKEAERTRQIALLSELSQALQGCVNNEELAELIERVALTLFPGSGGALLLKAASEVVELLHAWGDSNHEEAFPCQDCWALRIGRPYHSQQAGAPSCLHLREKHQDYICLPLIANGEILGVLHLSGLGAGAMKAGIPWAAKSIAERTAIAISVIRREERLQLRATRDALTGIYNRRFMEEALAIEQSRAERRGSSIGLMMMDVDFFKRFNDTYGHDAGDALLRGIGRLLRRAMREGDMPCRYGGEEFTIILPGADLEHTRQRAETIRAAIERWAPQQEGQAIGQVTVSIGIAAFPLNGTSWQAALKVADEALYAAKRSGRNRVSAQVLPLGQDGHALPLEGRSQDTDVKLPDRARVNC